MKRKKDSPELFAVESQEGRESVDPQAPLAARMRPVALEEVVGQSHLLGPGKLLRRTIESDRLSSVILYGPPGTGKTSIAKVISSVTHSKFVHLNAVESGVAELRGAVQQARNLKNFQKRKTLLFIDEIHRFNKAQQDVLMPDVEDGTVILIGATTQNPSFAINGPLLSRTLVCELRPLTNNDLKELVERALKNEERGLGKFKVKIDERAVSHLIMNSSGDARRLLNALEIGVLTTPPDDKGEIIFDRRVAEESCQRKIVYHDKDGDYHYDIASAFIKSMRGSDPDAAIYWLAKMLYGGEDPRFIVRRILILAAEDIGNADPQALILASAGLQAIEFVGMPEAKIILGQLVTYMACAPKSNASYMAIENALSDVQNERVEEVPDHLRDASYRGAKKMGHGQGYKYAHQYEDHYVEQAYINKKNPYYLPTQMGHEKAFFDRLEKLRSRGKK